MQASELKDRIRQKYVSCHSYQDSGCLERTHRETTSYIDFSTWFVRPNFFRFDWSNKAPFSDEICKRAIWSDNSNVYEWDMSIGIKPALDLSNILHRKRGVSCNTCFYIPGLFLNFDDNNFENINFTFVTEGTPMEASYYKLEGMRHPNESVSILICKETYSIRQITEKVLVDPKSLLAPDRLAQVTNDLIANGANAEEVLSPFISISKYFYKQVSINKNIATSIFNGPEAE